MQTGAGSLLLFLMLGLAGSAAPAHIGFRVLAYRQHLDKDHAFEPGTADGNWGYSWWLMRWRHRVLGDPSLNFFGGIAAGSGWLALVGGIGVIVLIALQ
ncbi:hypothetical protein [Arenimonas donghaensis]|uniref:Uncharacterized protein n=1 Tax=Arenimonas donghaensis DSM 18148 = HO3-R19 TaxID=1121014 RepID=A0A087MMF8_9GAMM|nr:hypothetical protein [Arenimonas donghaensis]KFL38061.1 hypothetical protein N788_02480 [Arenimonas donghaensis DSM 18148 = HO3-R19]